MAVATSMVIYQLKISLKGIYKPPIWRRVLISKDSTFKELHHVIQNTMDWSNTYLHKFRAPRPKARSMPRYDDSDREFEIGTIYEGENPEKFETYYSVKKLDETKMKLCDYFKTTKDLIEYVYDIGDSWELEIVLEQTLPSIVGKVYPSCVAGRRACPPEDGHLEDEDWKTKIFDPKSVTYSRLEEKVMTVETSLDIYQLRISIKRFKPPIWRRIHISKDSTFKELHYAVQVVMDWSNCHLHKFGPPCPKRGYMPEEDDFEIGTVYKEDRQESWIRKYDETKTKLCDYFKTPKDLIEYDYDFGSSWEHEIILEKILPPTPGKVYPACVSGKKARPPEECPVDSDDENDDWETEDFDPKSVDFSRFEKKKRIV